MKESNNITTKKQGSAVLWALAANMLIAVMKFVCAAMGSVAMLSEAVHSLADTCRKCI